MSDAQTKEICETIVLCVILILIFTRGYGQTK